VLLAFSLIVLFSCPSKLFADEPDAATADPSHVQAHAERVILLVRTPGDERVIQFLRAEVEQGEWRVVELRPDARYEPLPLGEVAAQQAATAVVRLAKNRREVELWVLGPNGPSEELISTPGEAPSDAVLALRATEALRARGLDFSPPDHSVLDAAPPSKPVPNAPPRAKVARPAPQQRPRVEEQSFRSLWVELGGGAGVSPGGLGALYLLGPAARADVSHTVGVSAAAWLPLTSPSVRGAEGSAIFQTLLVGGALEFTFARLDPLAFRVATGAFISTTRMTGTPDSGFLGRTESVVSTIPFVRGVVHAALGERFGVFGGACVGYSLPEVRMSFGDREAARFGRPILLASIGIAASVVSF
jgi:hypothetical protein